MPSDSKKIVLSSLVWTEHFVIHEVFATGLSITLNTMKNVLQYKKPQGISDLSKRVFTV